MKKLKDLTTIEYKYDSKEERDKHVEQMELIGFECDGQAKQTDDCLMSNRNPEYYWFARYFRYEK